MKRKFGIILSSALLISCLSGCNHQIKLVRTDTGNEMTVGDAVEMADHAGDTALSKVEGWFNRLWEYLTGSGSEKEETELGNKWNEIKDKTGSDIINDVGEKGSSVLNSITGAVYDYVTQDSQPTPSSEEPTSQDANPIQTDDLQGLEVQFLDVGQGDCIYITCGEDIMLIDTGLYEYKDKVLEYLGKQNIDKIDYLILTHPDSDHIGSAGAIVRNFDIDNIFAPDIERDTAAYGAFIEAAEDKGYVWAMPSIGTEYVFGDGIFRVLAPSWSHEDINDNSIVVKLEYGNTSYLFMGDAEEEEEMEIISMGHDVSADVIKLGHHGSKTSSSPEFLSLVEPRFAVISCGEGNEYGHPHAATMTKLLDMGVEMFRTDDQGIIISYSDGDNITWNIPASDNWSAGS